LNIYLPLDHSSFVGLLGLVLDRRPDGATYTRAIDSFIMSGATPTPTSEKTPLLDAAVQPSKAGGPSNGADKTSSNGRADSSEAEAPAKRVKGNPPSWREAFHEIVPFLKPEDSKHTVLAALALLAVLVEKLVAVVPPLAIRRAVDAIAAFGGSDNLLGENEYGELKRSTFETVTWSIVAFFLLKTLDSVISSFQTICQRSVSLDAERRFAVSLFKHMQVLGAAYHLERHAGEQMSILSRGTSATSTIIDALLFTLLPTFFEAFVISSVFAKVLRLPLIGLTTLASVALFLIYTVKVTNLRLDQRRRVIEKNDAVGRIETETLVNYETVAMFGREEKEVGSYGEVRSEYKEERVKMLSLFSLLQLGQQSIRLAGTCIGLWLAGRATVYGTSGSGGDELLSAGSFVVVQLYIQQLFQPLTYLGFTYRQLTEALTDLEKATTLLKKKPLIVDSPDAVSWNEALELQGKSMDASSGDITFDDVSFKYRVRKRSMQDDAKSGRRGTGFGHGRRGGGGRGMWSGHGKGNFWIKSAAAKDGKPNGEDDEAKIEMGGITNVSFHIPAGKTAALVGPSGSGKTTIVRLILRLYDADTGSVSVDGINVKAMQQTSLRSNIGVVAQETILFHSSLRENIIYGKEDASDEEVDEAVRVSALEALVKSMPDGLETLVGERGMKLSGGERQRVGLARCVIKQPKLVLLDEATSALDSGTEREIQRNILSQQAEVCKGRTTLMIAHRLSTARRADIILVLDKGSLVEQGTHDELLERGGLYAKLWSDQMSGETLDEL